MGSLLTLKLSTMQSKGIVPFPSHVTCKTHYILLACVPFPTLRATLIVIILQATDGRDSGKISVVWVYNTCIPRGSKLWMGNMKHIHEYVIRTGKFKQVYRKLKVISDMAMV